jgi:hypothetical protein
MQNQITSNEDDITEAISRLKTVSLDRIIQSSAMRTVALCLYEILASDVVLAREFHSVSISAFSVRVLISMIKRWILPLQMNRDNQMSIK